MLYSALQNIPDDLNSNFDEETILRGFQYSEQNRVSQLVVSKQGASVTAIVQGSRNNRYTVAITIDPDELPAESIIQSVCTCPVGANCKHAVAALVNAFEKNGKFNFSKMNHDHSTDVNRSQEHAKINQWLGNFATSATHDYTLEKPKDEHQLHYILTSPSYRKTRLSIGLKLARVLKNGATGKAKNFDPNSFSQLKYLTEEDHTNIVYVKIMNQGSSLSSYSTAYIQGKNSAKYLEHILKTGRCHFDNPENAALKMGEPKSIELRWMLLPNSNQAIQCFSNNKRIIIFILENAWYFDSETNTMGLAHIDLALPMLENFLSSPEVPHELISAVTQQIKLLLPHRTDLTPIAVAEPKAIQQLEPTPILQLSVEKIKSPQYPFQLIETPIAQVFFEYSDYVTVPFSFKTPQKIIKFLKDNQPHVLHRYFDSEKKYLLSLADCMSLSELSAPTSHNEAEKYKIDSIKKPDDYIDFISNIIPQLNMVGWRVVRNHEYFNAVVYEDDVAWYSELEESSGFDYFSFKLGIIIDDEKIDILPVVAKLFKNTSTEELKRYTDTQKISLPLLSGRVLSVSFQRIKPIINTLVELFDRELNNFTSVKFSRYQAELLHELENGFGATQMRWFGGERLRALGKKIAEFRTITPVILSPDFYAILRPYQQDGLNWLQFLREYQLNGILADDMGLGKTVQTIAHIAVEKQAKRITCPILIIAPTSLMFNWKKEIETFSPTLSVIVFHGDDRKAHQEKLSHYDIVLTTYPLLARDKDILLKHTFYYLILDEAQNIKNNQTKGTQIVHQIKAEHRLCLTGTPMENHLGDLWSLFHFLMPGLLGDVKQFNRLFRRPIEKEQNQDRQKTLSRRLKPFMLRRKKSEVMLELPEKTEIIRVAELQGHERDLYESIRLSMDKKVRDAIKTQGLNRSHIIILDALLKLRQVCCHPKLVKLAAAEKAHTQGSKLQLLQSMLPNMVEEGRRILIFSQFTSMIEIIEEMLEQEKLSYVRLTGDTKDRATPIAAFQAGKVPIFLISLKAGGTGLNLTAADTVIHYDPWWNPAVEDQATDRAHRIGQQKAVFVYKLLTAGTVEETIQEMQQKKRSLIEGLFAESANQNKTISAEDLQNLFKPLASPSEK